MSIDILWHKEVGPLACNCYIVGDRAAKQAVVIDPGGDADELIAFLADQHLTVTAVVATHAHFDHVIAAEQVVAQTGAPFHLHSDDKPLLDWMQASAQMFLGLELGPPPDVDTSPGEGDVLRAGAVELTVVHTPGHSPGSISLVHEEAIFSGDTLFAGSVGRTDLPGGDMNALVGAIRHKLFSLDEDLPVYPGHGPATTIGHEKRYNPFVGTAARLWLPGG